MRLHLLDDLIFGLGAEPYQDELDKLYAAFERDFVKNPFTIHGLKVKVVLTNSKVEGYEDYPETFVHLITRKSSSGHRVFDRHRANKIHWVKCILENREEEEILYFQYPEGDGSPRDYFWYEEEDFLVIMKQITPDYLVITSFHIDNDRNRKFYRKRYTWYLENGI